MNNERREGTRNAGARIPGLDELRGVAILAVLAGHLIGSHVPLLQQWLPATLFGPLVRATPTAGAESVIGGIDTVLPSVRGRGLLICGWALDREEKQGSGVSKVWVAVDDGKYRSALYGFPRQDVAAHFGQRFAMTGWQYDWQPADAAAGLHKLHVLAEKRPGESVRFERQYRVGYLPPWPLNARWYVVFAAISVDLFFVISGFLIAGILLHARGHDGYFRNFYLRRAARILPLAMLCVAASYIIYPETRDLVWRYVFFTNNYWPGRSMMTLGPMWSLAVEEQFYVTLPLVIAIVPRRRLWTLIGVLALASSAFRMLGSYSVVDRLYLTDGRTEVRILAILLGVWLALVQAELIPRPHWRWWALFAGWISLLFLLGGRAGWFDAFGLGGSLLVVWLAVTRRAVWRNSLFAYLGVRCYGLYLLHVPLLLLLQALAPGLPLPFFAAIWCVAVIAAAALSFRYFERPVITLVNSLSRQTMTFERRSVAEIAG